MSEAIIRELNNMRRELADLDKPETGVVFSTSNVSNPPTDAELDAIWGTARHAGFMAMIDDAGAGATFWLVAWDGTNWWYEGMTKAV